MDICLPNTHGDSFIGARAECGRGRGNRKAGGSLALYLVLFLSCITSGFLNCLCSIRRTFSLCLTTRRVTASLFSPAPQTSSAHHSHLGLAFLSSFPLTKSLGKETMLLNSGPRRVSPCCAQFVYLPGLSLSCCIASSPQVPRAGILPFICLFKVPGVDNIHL